MKHIDILEKEDKPKNTRKFFIGNLKKSFERMTYRRQITMIFRLNKSEHIYLTEKAENRMLAAL